MKSTLMTSSIGSILILSILLLSNGCTTPIATYVRPSLITTALETNQNVYYLGVGSNLLKEKVVNRGINGSTISVCSFGPARVENHRLAFNMRGFLPLEPSMGGIEVCEGSSCHGALMEMKASEYQKLWLSEGGGQPKPGYEEVIIQAYPYGSNIPVQAIALRASKHVRLDSDAPPSTRYMEIIIKGAEELKLDPNYISNLKAIPQANVSKFLQFLARKNYFFIGFLFRQKLRSLVLGLSRISWFFYYPGYATVPFSAFFADPDMNKMKEELMSDGGGMGGSGRVGVVTQTVSTVRSLMSNIGITAVILPGALIGILIELAYKYVWKTQPPGFLTARPPVKSPEPKTAL